MNVFLKKSELARRWGVSPKTIERLVSDGILPYTDLRHGSGQRTHLRFGLDLIERFERKGTVGGVVDHEVT